MRKRNTMTALMLFALAVGCVRSLHPIYTEQDVVFDPALVGTWSGDDKQDTWTFSKEGEKGYKLIYKDGRGETGIFDVHLLRLGNELFLDFFPVGPDIKQSDFFKLHIMAVHTFAHVRQITPTLQMAFPDPGWLNKLIAEKPDAVRHEAVDREIILTASTRELQEFWLKQVHTDGAFGEFSNLTRESEASRCDQVSAGQEEAATFTLSCHPDVMGSLVNYYRPIRVALTAQPQETLVAEPKYQSKEPLYGAIQLGDGADSLVTLVVDEAEGETPRIYIDRNNDEDLTNDGSGEWDRPSGSTLELSKVVVQAGYKTGTRPYMLDFYRFTTRLHDVVLYYRNSACEGEITSTGQKYKVAVLDENADGRFDDLENCTLLVDLNQDGKLVGDSESAEYYKANEPFNINGKVWEVASLSPDGTQVTLRPSHADVAMKPYLDPGYPAPTFTGTYLDGKSADLAQEAAGAKYILLDFWASWCGPCRGEFPSLRRLYARYKYQGLRIVGINLDSDRDAAVRAARENLLDYPHVFDGQGWKNPVAVLYRVHGIPQTYLLDENLNILAKDLRGPKLESRLAELLGPGDTAAVAAVDAAMEKHTDGGPALPPTTSPSQTELPEGALPEASESQLRDAAFVLFASPDSLAWTKPLAEILAGHDRRLSVARVATLDKALDSKAEVLVLLMPHPDPAEDYQRMLDRLKQRKVIGIGYGAAYLFGLLGLEINNGQCAHGVRSPARITVSNSRLLGESMSAEPLLAFEGDPGTEPSDIVSLYIPPKSELCGVVDVIARWTNDLNYAPVARQGNHVLVGIAIPPTTWTAAFAEWFHNLATKLHSCTREPFSVARWETTDAGTYHLTLGKSGQTDELSSKTFYFRIAKPTTFSAHLQHKGSDATMLLFMGQNCLHWTRQDAHDGTPLEIQANISADDIRSLGERYWVLKVTNFDSEHSADCQLSVKYE